jgi:hypothetical protein
MGAQIWRREGTAVVALQSPVVEAALRRARAAAAAMWDPDPERRRRGSTPLGPSARRPSPASAAGGGLPQEDAQL